MAAGELEYGIDPTKPRRRRPEPPARVPEARKSLDEGRPLALRWDNEQDALIAAREVVAAVRWLRKWEEMDIKVRPYVREWYVIGGEEIEARDLPVRPSRSDDHFWRTHFFVHPTLERGLRVANQDARDRSQAAAQQAKADLGLRPPVEKSERKARRTVRERGN